MQHYRGNRAPPATEAWPAKKYKIFNKGQPRSLPAVGVVRDFLGFLLRPGACLLSWSVFQGYSVRVHGLKSATGAMLNGMIGTVMGLDVSGTRMGIRLGEMDPPGSWKLIKPRNLEVLTDEGPSSGSAGASGSQE